MNKVLAINGRWYDVCVPVNGGLTREVALLDGDNAGRVKSGGINLDTIGSYYNYTYKVARAGNNFSDYDALHKELRNPATRKKMITVPFDQDFVTYEAYISELTDNLVRMVDGKNYWDGLSIRFTATDPNEVP